ncbi:hypothetical protein [Methylococcus sp. EFPC2]|uniref:hypothetical protein n=1 Tax=Methylococcus sp. EFPC2 TaxID=2812648 RepID=UPI001967D8CA|nr:hypothetical protein [Methylococcus sp. EFPC2]QSA96643.1 hypothetical protein JWZ97_15725 [Methylococcus sp. EFPC2]
MKLNLLLAKVLQFVTFVFFTIAVLVYFGLLLMLALAVLWYVTRILTLFGLPALLAVLAGIAALTYVSLAVSRQPRLYRLLWDLGLELITLGKTQIKRFDPLIEEARGDVAGSSAA